MTNNLTLQNSPANSYLILHTESQTTPTSWHIMDHDPFQRAFKAGRKAHPVSLEGMSTARF